MATKEQQPEIPDNVLDVLKTSGIGYLSVTSGEGELYSYPVAFYFSGLKIYFMTPISAAKLKFIRGNPNVSFLVDNHLLTKDACGAMFQGRAKVFSIAKTVVSILSVGPKIASFAKKYPGMFTFYTSGRELPDERKLYKYRLIRVEPSKILYWVGYNFGKYFPKSAGEDRLSNSYDETKMETFAELMKTADEELPPRHVEQSQEWADNLVTAEKEGVISPEEVNVINSYRNFLRGAVAANQGELDVSASEKKLLGKWKKSDSR
jgi:hypothetical protein